jgi:hypothetical protein
MWPATFSARLDAWNLLRSQAQTLPVESALDVINQWWFRCPWRPYHLHWDDRQDWPDPWQLLSDNIYCDLARALGIVYTITLLDRHDIHDAVLISTEKNHNLVLVANEKYILNWDSSTVLNTIQVDNIKRRVDQSQLKKQYT